MGEIANDMIEGRCCALCGQYFVKSNIVDNKEYEIMGGEELYEHGYPVACKDCWEPGCGYQKAITETL